MRHRIVTKSEFFSIFFILLLFIISGGPISAEAVDSKATFTVQ